MATPSPPAAQAVLSPNPRPGAAVRCRVWVIIRARWRQRRPKASELPSTLNLSMSTFADGLILAQLVTGKFGACKHLEVGERLGSKSFVHVDEGEIL